MVSEDYSEKKKTLELFDKANSILILSCSAIISYQWIRPKSVGKHHSFSIGIEFIIISGYTVRSFGTQTSAIESVGCPEKEHYFQYRKFTLSKGKYSPVIKLLYNAEKINTCVRKKITYEMLIVFQKSLTC